ncbi:hypothetical protein ACH6EH_01410 [Paenibacillus sp. JSM ZJ436]|uniref:hypothetical protein n=1 Tax=Paenibacillus sp. JSM ZJ436 TaxID=3376190 RepID=UPI0037B8A8DB
MKITDFAILFTAVFAPFFLGLSLQGHELEETAYLEMKYNAALKAAVQDAGYMLHDNAEPQYEAGYESLKTLKINKEKALDTFSQTLYRNFGIHEDVLAQGALWTYIPAVAIIDEDGFYVYSTELIPSAAGETLLKQFWSSKIPFAYTDDQGNYIQFTLDRQVKAYQAGSGILYEGMQDELVGQSSIPLLNDSVQFEAVRRTTIVHTLQSSLASLIARHNEAARSYGITYQFTLPLLSEEDWLNTIDDIGVMAFIQGMPLGSGYFNNYAFGGGRLIKKPVYFGTSDPVYGQRLFYRDSCVVPYSPQEVFFSRKAAAKAGYKEVDCTSSIIP